MVEIQIRYEGGLRTYAVHLQSGSIIETDAPLDNKGRGERFSPTDMVATALGACMLTIMGIAAESKNFSITGSKARVEKHMRSEPFRSIGKIVVEFSLPAALNERERLILERSALECPVIKSLNPEIDLDIRFNYAI